MNSCNMSPENRAEVLAIFQQTALDWCRSNAGACALEEYVNTRHPDEIEELLKYIIHDYDITKKVAETYPF